MGRIAVISVPLAGAPVDTRLPFRSLKVLMPLPSTVTRACGSARTPRACAAHTLWSLNLSSPLAASRRCVGDGEAHLGLAAADQLQVGHRAGGHLRGRVEARDVLGTIAAKPPPRM